MRSKDPSMNAYGFCVRSAMSVAIFPLGSFAIHSRSAGSSNISFSQENMTVPLENIEEKSIGTFTSI